MRSQRLLHQDKAFNLNKAFDLAAVVLTSFAPQSLSFGTTGF